MYCKIHENVAEITCTEVHDSSQRHGMAPEEEEILL